MLVRGLTNRDKISCRSLSLFLPPLGFINLGKSTEVAKEKKEYLLFPCSVSCLIKLFLKKIFNRKGRASLILESARNENKK